MEATPAIVPTARWFDPDARAAHRSIRLLCFPHAGGSAFVFRDWPRDVSPAIDVVPIQLPGRAERLSEPPFRRVPALVEAARAALRPILDRPVALFGHSVGGAIAFELACVLEREHGRPVEHLFIAGRGAPDCPMRRPPIAHLPPNEFVAAVRQLQTVPGHVFDHPDAIDLFMPILRADLELSETYAYVPGRRVGCPITVFGGHDDPWARTEDLEGWQRHTTRDCQVHLLPGDHFFVSRARVDILRVIERRLRKEDR
jgi:surfactin synthase thioesterase subunit